MDNANTYWNGSGQYQKAYERLNKLIPAMGEVEGKDNRALERLRKYANAYYDLFNNGGCNRGQEISRYFPGALRQFRNRRIWGMDKVYAITEPAINKVVIMAALEQGINLNEEG